MLCRCPENLRVKKLHFTESGCKREKKIVTSNPGFFPHFTGEETEAQRRAYDRIAGQSAEKQDWGLSPGLHPLASEASVSLLIKWRQRSGSMGSSRGCSMFLLRVGVAVSTEALV